MDHQATEQEPTGPPSGFPPAKLSRAEKLSLNRQAERVLCDDVGLRNLLITEILTQRVVAALDNFLDGYEMPGGLKKIRLARAIVDGVAPCVQRMVDEQRQSTLEWAVDNDAGS